MCLYVVCEEDIQFSKPEIFEIHRYSVEYLREKNQTFFNGLKFVDRATGEIENNSHQSDINQSIVLEPGNRESFINGVLLSSSIAGKWINFIESCSYTNLSWLFERKKMYSKGPLIKCKKWKISKNLVSNTILKILFTKTTAALLVLLL